MTKSKSAEVAVYSIPTSMSPRLAKGTGWKAASGAIKAETTVGKSGKILVIRLFTCQQSGQNQIKNSGTVIKNAGRPRIRTAQTVHTKTWRKAEQVCRIPHLWPMPQLWPHELCHPGQHSYLHPL